MRFLLVAGLLLLPGALPAAAQYMVPVPPAPAEEKPSAPSVAPAESAPETRAPSPAQEPSPPPVVPDPVAPAPAGPAPTPVPSAPEPTQAVPAAMPAAPSIVEGRSYVVVSKAANVRPAPSTEGAPVAWLQRGTRVRVVSGPEGNGDWRRIERGDRPIGFLHVSVLADEEEAIARGRDLLRDAFDYLRVARFDVAADLLKDGLALAPGSGPATFYLGESLFALSRFDEAATQYRRVLEIAPGTEEARRAALRLRDLEAPALSPGQPAVSPPPAAIAPPRAVPLEPSPPAGATPLSRVPSSTIPVPAPVADPAPSLRLFAAARVAADAMADPAARLSTLLAVAAIQARAGALDEVAVTLGAAETVLAASVAAADPARRREVEASGWGAIAGLQCRAGLRDAAAETLGRKAVVAGDDVDMLARLLVARARCGMPAAAEEVFGRIEALASAPVDGSSGPADDRQSLLARRLAVQGAFPWALRIARGVGDASWRWLAVNGIILQLQHHGRFEEAAALAADPAAEIAADETVADVGEPGETLLQAAPLDPPELETAFGHLVARADRALDADRADAARAALARAERVARAPGMPARDASLARLTRRLAELGDVDPLARIARDVSDPALVPGVQADLIVALAASGDLAAAAEMAARLDGEPGLRAGIGVARGLAVAGEDDFARPLAVQMEEDAANVASPPVRARLLAEIGRVYREIEAAGDR